MTTVIIKDGHVAADRRSTFSGRYIKDNSKFVPFEHDDMKGFVIYVGMVRYGERILEWVLSGAKDPEGKFPTDSNGEIILLLSTKKVRIYTWTTKNGFVTVKHSVHDENDPPYFHGSGSNYAEGAIASGASFKEAFRIVSMFDTHTSAQFDVFNFVTHTFVTEMHQ